VRSFLLHLILIISDLLGVNRLFRRLNVDKVRVLMYHSVTSRSLPSQYWTRLDVDKFVWQMQYIKRHYSVVPASELVVRGEDDKRAAKHRVVITFDDGLENTFHEAWPVLKAHELVAVVFVLPALSESGGRIWADELYEQLISAATTDLDLSNFDLGHIYLDPSPGTRAVQVDRLLNAVKSWPPGKCRELLQYVTTSFPNAEGRLRDVLKLMSKDQIIELGQSKEFDIGGHTDSHPILSTLSPEEQQDEIARCLEGLKQWGVDTVPIFAYPNGHPDDFTQDTIAALKQVNVEAAVTTVDGLHDRADNRFHIKRVAIGEDITRSEFKARLSGLYYFLRRLAGGRG
jgi:peptidoglycan/xylan/chitin deacetylase (PgdA/CDA1 family)